MQIAVHDYQTTERVGAMDIGEVSGAEAGEVGRSLRTWTTLVLES